MVICRGIEGRHGESLGEGEGMGQLSEEGGMRGWVKGKDGDGREDTSRCDETEAVRSCMEEKIKEVETADITGESSSVGSEPSGAGAGGERVGSSACDTSGE